MATWHQSKNGSGLAALWAPSPGKWKCISDRPGKAAGAMLFDNEADARRYAAKTGDVVIPPSRERNRGEQ